jgi:hypothetical protein
MTQKKPAAPPKKPAPGAKPHSLTKTAKKGDVELSEKELARASGGTGGAGSGKIKF